MANVRALFRAPKKRVAMQELSEARVVENAGFDGGAHARPGGKRQMLLVARETLRALDLGPGMVRENITTERWDVNGLKVGQKLRVGEVELEVSLVCEPCEELGKLRAGWKAERVGRRGMLCRVGYGGIEKSGDSISLEG